MNRDTCDGTMTDAEIDDLCDVLLDFELACPLPTMDDVREWQARHPAYAQEILEQAAEIAEGVLDGSLMEEPTFDVRDDDPVVGALVTAA